MQKHTPEVDTDLVRQIIEEKLKGKKFVYREAVIFAIEHSGLFSRPYLHTKAIRWKKDHKDGELNVHSGAEKVYIDTLRHLHEYAEFEDENGEQVIRRDKPLSKDYQGILEGMLTSDPQFASELGRQFMPHVTKEDALKAYKDHYPDASHSEKAQVVIGKRLVYRKTWCKLLSRKKMRRQYAKDESMLFRKIESKKRSNKLSKGKYEREFYADDDKAIAVETTTKGIIVRFTDGRKTCDPFTPGMVKWGTIRVSTANDRNLLSPIMKSKPRVKLKTLPLICIDGPAAHFHKEWKAMLAWAEKEKILTNDGRPLKDVLEDGKMVFYYARPL